jgi:type IV pilus assembly protein PilY1
MLRACIATLSAASIAGALATSATPASAALAIGNNPLYLVVGKANVLITLDNSNSMDEAPDGSAVGSGNAASKSEIARGVVRNLTDTYRNRVNMGLMAYRQNSPSAYHLHNSPYDASFDPATYNPGWTGTRASPTNKRFRIPNPVSSGDFIYYNVALPFYSTSNYGNAFCYSTTANSAPNVNYPDGFNNGENPSSGPWDNYRCFTTKTGTSNALPTWANAASETAAGYSGYWFQSSFHPTDSDFAQGILDFGRFMTWHYASRTWFRNDSPGRGYLHIPLGDLNSTQAAAIKSKLRCSIPGGTAPCTNNVTDSIPNAGLTPIEGTLLTALDYYKGTWSNTSEGYTASCYPLPQSCGKNFVVLLTDGLPSTNKNGVALTNPATAIAEAAAAAAALKAQGIETYVIGFALPYGTDPSTLNQIAVAGGTETAFNAGDSASLTAAFDAIFQDIFRKSSAFGAVSQNSTSINTGSMVFQGRFDSTDWSGEVVAMRPAANGTLTQVWNASDAANIPAPALRKVFTFKPGTGGVEFKTLTDLTSTQQTALASTNCSAALTGSTCAQARIDWMRGDRSREDPAGPLRRRSKLFGDVISSSPVYVKSTNTLFVGANDGMLHAIDASNGAERFTFVPNAVISSLPQLTAANYAHRYFVDGEIAVSTTAETAGKNILVGALGRGGRALYALDVTNPAAFDATKVMWEFTDPDLGLVLGRPIIAKMNNGKTAVIVGNGYNSDNERAVLFIIDIDTGALIKKIDTQAGNTTTANNGMASPRGWDTDGSGTVDVVYAGDLLGNVWKFNVGASNTSSWGSSHTSGSTPAPLFVATDSAGTTRQPITGMIGVGMNYRKGDANFGKRYVFVGTGRYITSSDVTNTAVQSWYGLIDDDTTTIARSDLKLRSIVEEGTIGTASVRSFELATAGDMAGKRGWVVDMVSPTSGGLGERFIGENKFFGSVLTAASMIPSSDPCTPGGEGYLNAIDPFTGASVANLFFDANNDLVFNDLDRLGSTTRRPVGSINPRINLPSDGILIGNRLITSGTSGELRSVSINNPVRSGRITWREVVNP